MYWKNNIIFHLRFISLIFISFMFTSFIICKNLLYLLDMEYENL